MTDAKGASAPGFIGFRTPTIDPVESDRVQALLDEAAEIAADRARDEVWTFQDRLSDICDSPIESLFAIAMCLRDNGGGIFEVSNILYPSQDRSVEQCYEVVAKEAGEFSFFKHGPIDRVFLFPQTLIENYRVDFFVIGLRYDAVMRSSGSEAQGYATGRSVVSLIVECDGHDYHDRTKAQAARDKKRDRAIQASGYPVFRFTGSELHKDPHACALEVERYLRRQWNPKWTGIGHG